MSLVLIAGPTVEPVSIAEAKAHLRVDTSVEDALIASLIVTSRLQIEATLGLALITQSWSYLLDRWPSGADLELPLRPVQSIQALRLYASDDTSETLPASSYLLDGAAAPSRLVWRGPGRPRAGRRANGIEVTFAAGFGATPADVPAPIRQALLILVAHWYEHREPTEIGSAAPLPALLDELLSPWRVRRL